MAAYSPYGPASQASYSFVHGPPPPPPTDMASFENRAHSFSGQPTHYAGMSAPTQSHMSQASGGSFRSVGESNGYHSQQQQQPSLANPQIYTAVYSNVAVYEMEVNGVAVMRRRADSWLNATQILKVAGIDKGRRTKILEKEILTGHHEKIQGGYGRYQGTWISYERGRNFCRQYGVEDILRPLLDYDLSSDGTQASNKLDTPTKEQAMAANRKRFYNASVEGRTNGQSGTFFSNISPTASSALAAMNKLSRYDSPMPRPGSAQRRPNSLLRRTSSQQQQQTSQDMPASQQSVQGYTTDRDMVNAFADAGFVQRPADDLEPPRKRAKPTNSQDNDSQMYMDPAMYEETPTEPAESFSMVIDPPPEIDGMNPLPPLQPPRDDSQEQKQTALMDLFADPARFEYANHPALMQLSGSDLDMPLDQSGNTALHWAATLARVELVRVLLKRGANMFHGNVAGQTPLISAVLVNNTFDRGKFPELLECLGPLIELRDTTGRTVLHHIAVSSGIQGRAQSSKYYLDSLLEFIVRQGGSNPSSQSTGGNGSGGGGGGGGSTKAAPKNKLMLARFMAEVVNVQDKSGNTALNLAARIGNRAIIDQLEEVGADFYLANNTNFRPVDFGVVPRQQAASQKQATQSTDSSQSGPPSQIDQIREDILATMSAVLTQTTQNYSTELAKKQTQIDTNTSTLKTVAQQHKEELAQFEILQARSEERNDRQQRITNLRRAIIDSRQTLARKGLNAQSGPDKYLDVQQVDLEQLPPAAAEAQDGDNDKALAKLSEDQETYLASLPPASKLAAYLEAYTAQMAALQSIHEQLQRRSTHHEQQYRKITALCARVPESSVEANLDELLVAVESEGFGDAALLGRTANSAAAGNSTAANNNNNNGSNNNSNNNGGSLPAASSTRRDLDMAKVRDFLRRVEAVEA